MDVVDFGLLCILLGTTSGENISRSDQPKASVVQTQKSKQGVSNQLKPEKTLGRRKWQEQLKTLEDLEQFPMPTVYYAAYTWFRPNESTYHTWFPLPSKPNGPID